MLGRKEIEALIPHRGAMCLLERVIEWDSEHVVLATATHRAADNPLRSGGHLRAIHLCEYGAQAMAVHGGLMAQAKGQVARPGFLVSLREVQLHTEFVDQLPGELVVTAKRLLESTMSWQYSFEINYRESVLATGRAAIMARAL